MADKLYVEIGADIKALQKSLNDATQELQDFRKETEDGFKKAANSSKELQDQLKNTRKGMNLLNQYTKGLGEGWVKVAKSVKAGGAAMKSALIASGVGALLVIIGEIVANWDAIAGWITGSTERIRLQKIELDKITEALKEQVRLRNEYNSLSSQAEKLVIAEAKALGKSQGDIAALTKKFNEDKLRNLEKNEKDELARLATLKKSLLTAEEESQADIKKSIEASDAELLKISAAYTATGTQIQLNAYAERLRLKEIYDKKLLESQKRTSASFIKADPISGAFKNTKETKKAFNEIKTELGGVSGFVAITAEEMQQSMGSMFNVDQILADREALGEQFAEISNVAMDFNNDMKNLIAGSIAGTFADLGTVIGESLASGENVLSAMGQSILNSMGQFLGDLGEMLISYGTFAVIKGALDKAITAGGPASIAAGAAAIGVGIAMMAISGAIGQRANAGMDGSGGGGSASSASGSVGGGSSRSYSGSGASSGSNSGGGTYVFEIAGTKLIGVMKNTLDRNKALGGASLSFG